MAERVLQETATVRDRLLWRARGVDDRVKLVRVDAGVPDGLARSLRAHHGRGLQSNDEGKACGVHGGAGNACFAMTEHVLQ